MVVVANLFALSMALYWIYLESDSENFEPYVSSAGMLGVLLGLFYVNNRITKPYIKVSAEIVMLAIDIEEPTIAINISIANHSTNRFYLDALYFELDNNTTYKPYRDYMGQDIGKNEIDSSKKHTFLLCVQTVVADLNSVSAEIKRIKVVDQLGYKFYLKDSDCEKVRAHIKKPLNSGFFM